MKALLACLLLALCPLAFGQDVVNKTDGNLIIPALINHQSVGTFIIDTGSTYVVITPEMAKALGIQTDHTTPQETIITASGMETLPKVKIKSITIGKIEAKDIDALIKPFNDDPLLAGLLGMSFLNKIDIRINHGKVTLEEK